LVAAGKTKKAIHIKKGQFLHPADMKHSAAKAQANGNNNILLCERGACFGYRDLVVDMRSLQIMRGLGFPVVFDATHSVQSMGGEGGASGGSREFIPALVRAACAVGIDGLFLECHEEPSRAPSDAASMLPLESFKGVLESALKIRETLKS
jgi:2-dehydro-3-deoxyphosphooctonate aldolase (KDO 8-P synthase)